MPGPHASRNPELEWVPVARVRARTLDHTDSRHGERGNRRVVIPAHHDVRQLLAPLPGKHFVANPHFAHRGFSCCRINERGKAGAQFLTQCGVLRARRDDALRLAALQIDPDASFKIGGQCEGARMRPVDLRFKACTQLVAQLPGQMVRNQTARAGRYQALDGAEQRARLAPALACLCSVHVTQLLEHRGQQMPARIVGTHAITAHHHERNVRGQRRSNRAYGAVHCGIHAVDGTQPIRFGRDRIARTRRPQVMSRGMSFAERRHHQIPLALLHQPLQRLALVPNAHWQLLLSMVRLGRPRPSRIASIPRG